MIQVEETPVFSAWLRSLRDDRAKGQIASRVRRLASGNPGDVAPVGEGVSELRIHHGPGYRVYFVQHKASVVVLCGGGQEHASSRHPGRERDGENLGRNGAMTLETRPFDPAEYLDTDEALAAYLTEALDTGDPAFISDSLAVIARARRRFGTAETSGRPQDNIGPAIGERSDPQLRAVLETVRALGLRLEATVAQPEPAGP